MQYTRRAKKIQKCKHIKSDKINQQKGSHIRWSHKLALKSPSSKYVVVLMNYSFVFKRQKFCQTMTWQQPGQDLKPPECSGAWSVRASRHRCDHSPAALVSLSTERLRNCRAIPHQFARVQWQIADPSIYWIYYKLSVKAWSVASITRLC